MEEMTTLATERRCHQRVRGQMLGVLREPVPPSLPVTVVDFSAGGALIHTHAALEPGSIGALQFGFGDKQVSVPVTIVRKAEDISGWSNGCAFADVPSTAQAVLLELIEAR